MTVNLMRKFEIVFQELLALGEQIGHVTTGLSEETIFSHLKTRTYMNLEEAACTDEETDFCVVCQVLTLLWPYILGK